MFGLPTQRDRQQLLHEYSPTNYSVVNVRTIDSVSHCAASCNISATDLTAEQLYEVMYHQKVLDGIKARTGQDEETNRTRITLYPYTSILSADTVPASPDAPGYGEAVRLTMHGVLNRAVTHQTYDAVFCGTGYDRDSWMKLLASSNLAEDFDIKSSAVQLVTEAEPLSQPIPPLFTDLPEITARGTRSSVSDGSATPPTPDTPHSEHSKLSGETRPSKVRISRTYRLLSEKNPDAPRIYLQGCTQSTHGLSESLLSILGVRAGMVVDELFQA